MTPLGRIAWQYHLPQEREQQAPQRKKKSGGGLGGLLGMVGGIIGNMDFGEPPIGEFAPNIDGMEGMGLEPGPAMPAPTYQPVAPAPTPVLPPADVTTPSPQPTGHPYMAQSPLQQTAATYQPGVGQMVPLSRMAVGYGPPAPGSPFAAIQNDPRYVNRIAADGPKPLDINNVREVHLHDRGGRTPNTNNYRALPYHVEVQPDGRIVQTRAANQQGAGSFKSNPRTLHVTYGGKVGALPTKAAMSSLQKVYETMKLHNPSWQFPSHGEAFAATRNSPWRASVTGRGPSEARWRGFLR